MADDEARAVAEMDLEGTEPQGASDAGDASAENGVGKRARAEGEAAAEEEEEEEESGAEKKQKVERSVEEERSEGKVAEGGDAKEEGAGVPVKLGPKEFGTSVEMFDYFYKFLHAWALNLDINKYEWLVLHELLKKGHPDHIKKIGVGLSFQVRYHPLWKSRCFFIARTDGSSEDFSFRKCVDQIIPLPDDMKAPDRSKGGRDGGGGRGGQGRGGRGGRGRRGRS